MERAAGRFVLGSRVTVCADEAGTQVLRFGTVKRVGNGGASWRLQGTGEWYDAVTGVRLGGFDRPHYARPYREGDETLQAHAREAHRLQATVTLRAGGLSSAGYARVQCERAIFYAEVSRADAERSLARATRELAEHRARLVVLREQESEARAALHLVQEELKRHVERR